MAKQGQLWMPIQGFEHQGSAAGLSFMSSESNTYVVNLSYPHQQQNYYVVPTSQPTNFRPTQALTSVCSRQSQSVVVPRTPLTSNPNLYQDQSVGRYFNTPSTSAVYVHLPPQSPTPLYTTPRETMFRLCQTTASPAYQWLDEATSLGLCQQQGPMSSSYQWLPQPQPPASVQVMHNTPDPYTETAPEQSPMMITASNPNYGRQQPVQQDGMILRRKKMHCSFCARNGETREYFSSHWLKDLDGNVKCPILWKYTCPRCAATGDSAHTLKHCPLNENAATTARATKNRPKRNSRGIIGSYKYY